MLRVHWFGVSTVLLLLPLLLTHSASAYKDYKNFRIYDIRGHTESQQRILYDLSADGGLDFLDMGRELGSMTRVLVPPERVPQFEGLLRQQAFDYTCLIRDASIVLTEERERQRQLARMPLNSSTIFERFYRHHEINEYLEALAHKYPQRLYVKTVGRTYEGRWLKTLTIGNGDGRANKKVIFIDAAIHAREWIVPSMALHIIAELVENMQANAHLLEHYDWVVLPVLNADGYEYSHDIDRMWRKTRKPNNNNSNCMGTDGNRNYEYAWGLDIGSSPNPCSQTYRGAHAFSEPETRVLRDLIHTYRGRLQYYLSLHSYGNYILLPWGFQSEKPETYGELMAVAEAGAWAIANATGTAYRYGSTIEVLYATAGDSADYVYGSGSAPIAMIMELPKGGDTGFDPPPMDIEQIVTETWIGIRAMAALVVDKY